MGDTLITLNDCWHYQAANLVSMNPAVDSSNIYIAEEGGRLSAIALSSGTRIWSTELGGEIRSNIIVDSGNVYVITSVDGKRTRLRSVSRISGIPNFEVVTPDSQNTRLGLGAGRIIAVFDPGTVAAYDPGADKPAWQIVLDQVRLSVVVFQRDKLLLSSANNMIHVVSALDGKEILAASAKRDVTSLGFFEGDLLWGEDRGNLVRYDTESRSISWRFKNGARIVNAIPTERGVVATSLDNFVYLLSGYNGDIRWKKRLSGRVSGFAISGDVGIVLTIGEPVAVLLNLENGKAAGQFSLGDDDGFVQPPIIAGDKVVFFTGSQVLAKSTKPCASK